MSAEPRGRFTQVVLASTISVGPVDSVLVYALGWICLGTGWGLGEAFRSASRERQEQQRYYDETGLDHRAKLDFGGMLVGALQGAFSGFLIGGVVGLLLALVALIFGIDVHNEAKMQGL